MRGCRWLRDDAAARAGAYEGPPKHKHHTILVLFLRMCVWGAHLSVAQLDSWKVEGVGGVGGAEAHPHVHVVAAGGEGGVED